MLIGLLFAIGATTLYVVVDEVRSSRRQAALISKVASGLRFHVEPGPSGSIRFPAPGPYDERLGYSRLPQLIEQLQTQGFVVDAQARMSPRLMAATDLGLFATYREKSQAGLRLQDCRGDPTATTVFPRRVYQRFEDVPPVLVESLLFIEDRRLLEPRQPLRNPTVQWGRLWRAIADQARSLLDDSHPTPGGSTLATQIEKYRHSPEGRTDSIGEKLRQMASASLRAYLDGKDTVARRQQIVVDYLNTVPLAARFGYGEVNGLGDGMWAWYGRDFDEINRVLADRSPAAGERLQRRALAFKQALSLLIAQRRPSHYLPADRTGLRHLTDSYLRLLADARVIDIALREAALPLELKPAMQPPADSGSFVERKAATSVKTRLLGLLDVPRVYDLERFDLEVGTTVDAGLQRAATETLRSLRDPAGAKAAGLYGYRLLNEGDATDKVILSFTLFERGEHANWLRVQTDNFDQPFDVNEGARLDMGSTAKLRTLITYLELVADLHRRLSAHDAQALPAPRLHPKDNLGRWARAYLARARDRGLAPMLEAALQRTYSASPAETFFTGGGAHRFENFDRAEDGRVYTVRDAFKHSVNLVFIRLMRDIVQHLIYGEPGARSGLLDDPANPHRREYLARFADREGRQFIAGFYRKYRGLPAAEAEDLLLRSTGATPVRLASVYGALEPDGSAAGFAAFLAARLPRARLSEPAIQALFEKYGPQRWSWADRGYLAGVHPLELWLVAYLRRHPGAGLFDVFEASRDERQDAYTWLFRTRNKSAQDLRIRMLLELDAFAEIQRSWRRLGYPFEALTPSYATAIGASGDRPAALAELMGIVVNDGMRLPVRRIKSLTFAGGTPYETRLVVRPSEPQRVLAPEVAWLVRRSLVDVVEDGTARRIKGALARPDGVPVEVGGKTGTGDHRFEVYASDGRLVSSRVVARSATFVFLIGDRYFGTLMAYVPEPDAARYKFTSALPAQLLKSMAPALTPLVEERVCAPHGMSVAASAPAASIGGAR